MMNARIPAGILLSALLGAVLFAIPAEAQVTLNEIRRDQVGTDEDEFIELLGPALTSLNGLSVIVIGDSGAATNGVVEEIADLNGLTTGPDGLFTLAENTCRTCGAGCPDLRADINLENSERITILIVSGRNPRLTAGVIGFGGSVVDKDQNGVIDATGDWDGNGTDDGPPWTAVIDCLALLGGTADLIYCSTTVGPDGTSAVSHAYACPPGGTWSLGSFTDLQFDSPCAANPLCAPVPAEDVSWGKLKSGGEE